MWLALAFFGIAGLFATVLVLSPFVGMAGGGTLYDVAGVWLVLGALLFAIAGAWVVLQARWHPQGRLLISPWPGRIALALFAVLALLLVFGVFVEPDR